MKRNEIIKYIVISYKKDSHISFVEKHLDSPFLILDPSIGLDKEETTIRWLNDDYYLYFNEIPLKDVVSIWFRRMPKAQKVQVPIVSYQKEFSISALYNYALLLETRFPNALWVSNAFATSRAEDKILQLSVAKKIGFHIPETIVTTSPEAAKRFVSDQKSAIAKPINVGGFQFEGKYFGFYTSKVTKDTEFSGLSFSPTIFQEAIDVDVDIRVTVVGESVFAATIRSKQIDDPSSHVRDWRIANDAPDLAIEEYGLPKKVSQLCVLHSKELGLMYGAIDLILDKKGRYWFLENNPGGQWAFIEEKTKQPIGKTLAEMLMKGSTN
jgi:glutathione synthase/RimK-type ligase-like ATP-grasp enzyme